MFNVFSLFKLKSSPALPEPGTPVIPSAEWRILISAFFGLVLPIFLYTSWLMGHFSYPGYSWLLWLYPAPFFPLAWAVHQRHRGWAIFAFWYFLLGSLALTALHRGGLFWVFFFSYTFWLGLRGMKQIRRAESQALRDASPPAPPSTSPAPAPTFRLTMSWSYWLAQTFRQYRSFRGRAPRREYWFFAAIYVLIMLTANLLDRSRGWHTPDAILSSGLVIYGFGYVYLGCFLLLLLPKYTVMVRRLHDRNLSGWWVLLSLVPILGWLILLGIACRRSTPGPNRFGPPPLPVS